MIALLFLLEGELKSPSKATALEETGDNIVSSEFPEDYFM